MLKVTQKTLEYYKGIRFKLKVQKIAKIGLKIRDTISFDKLEVATHFNLKKFKHCREVGN